MCSTRREYLGHRLLSKSDDMMADIAVVIPALNERDNLELLVPALTDVLSELRVQPEIVVVDGGSSDGTLNMPVRTGVRVIRQEDPGYGGALLAGFAETEAPYIVTMDADLSHRPVFLHEFWRLRNEAEVLIASRYVEGGRADMGWFRWVLSRSLNTVYRWLLSIEIRDLSSGFRMYRRETLIGLTLVARDFDILEEILIRVQAAGWRIREVPFHYMPRGSGRSHVRLFRFGKAFLRTLIRMKKLRKSAVAMD